MAVGKSYSLIFVYVIFIRNHICYTNYLLELHLNNLSISPDAFEIIEQTVFFGKQMHNDISIVHQNPC